MLAPRAVAANLYNGGPGGTLIGWLLVEDMMEGLRLVFYCKIELERVNMAQFTVFNTP